MSACFNVLTNAYFSYLIIILNKMLSEARHGPFLQDCDDAFYGHQHRKSS